MNILKKQFNNQEKSNENKVANILDNIPFEVHIFYEEDNESKYGYIEAFF